MSKFNFNKKVSSAEKFNIVSFFRNFFSSKKNIIITSCVAVVLLACAIIIPIVVSNKNGGDSDKKKITINFIATTTDDNNNSVELSTLRIYKNTDNSPVTTGYGTFSIDNYKNTFEENDVLRIQRQDYILTLVDGQTKDLKEQDGYILLTVTKDMTIKIFGRKKTDEEELLAKSIVLTFKDQNGKAITSQIKAMQKSTIPVENFEYDYESSSITILGTSTDSKLMLTIDDNQTTNMEVYFYSTDYDFDTLNINKTLQGTTQDIIGTVKIPTNMKGKMFYLKFPDDSFVSNLNASSATINYNYVNTYNEANTTEMKTYRFTNAQASSNIETVKISFTDNTLFEVLNIYVIVNGKYYYANYHLSLENNNIITLSEGILLKVRYRAGKDVEITDKDGVKTILTAESTTSAYINYISGDFTGTTFKAKGGTEDGKAYEVVKTNRDISEIVEKITLSNQSIIDTIEEPIILMEKSN